MLLFIHIRVYIYIYDDDTATSVEAIFHTSETAAVLQSSDFFSLYLILVCAFHRFIVESYLLFFRNLKK